MPEDSGVGVFALGCCYTLSDPDHVRGLLERYFDFREVAAGDGWFDLENGALRLHLRQGAPSEPIELEVHTQDLEAAESLFSETSPTRLRCVDRDTLHQERLLELCPELRVLLVRRVPEDELLEPLSLPTQLPWTPAAVDLVQNVLALVPETFRADARRRYTSRAEALATSRGDLDVDARVAAEGIVQETPTLRQQEIRSELAQRGFFFDS